MCAGVAVLMSELPVALIEQHGLEQHRHERGGEPEIRFLLRHVPAMLPVWHDGQLKIVRWGNRSRRSRLPCTAWAWQATLEAGGWSPFAPEAVDIPCQFGWERGVWFSIRQGVRGLLVSDEQGVETVYMLCEPPTRYYRVMTRSQRMPVLIEEVI